ncbi:hypothetical protein ACFSTC_62755 [Nonomuraea ferruginea]
MRTVRTREEYRAWYPEFGASGLVAATWEVDYGGLGWSRRAAVAADEALRPYHLPRLNPLGLNLAAPRPVRPRHGGTTAALPQADHQGRGDLVPAFQRARLRK